MSGVLGREDVFDDGELPVAVRRRSSGASRELVRPECPGATSLLTFFFAEESRCGAALDAPKRASVFRADGTANRLRLRKGSPTRLGGLISICLFPVHT